MTVIQVDIIFNVAGSISNRLVITGCWCCSTLGWRLEEQIKLFIQQIWVAVQNEWTWRLFCGSQVVGFICICYLAIANDNNCIYFLILVGIMKRIGIFLIRQFWTEHHENWFFVTAFLSLIFNW